MKNIAGKLRKVDNPYATWTDQRTGWKYRLLKSWQTDNSKEYARWFVEVHGFGHDIGDVYVKEVRNGIYIADDLWFDETVWSSQREFIAWAFGER